MKKFITILISCFINSCVNPINQNNTMTKTQEQSNNSKTDTKDNKIIDNLPTNIYIEESSNIQIIDLTSLKFDIVNKDILSEKDGILYAKSKGETTINIIDSLKKINIHVLEEQKDLKPYSAICAPTDLCSRTTINGNIYDIDKKLLNDVKVKAYSLDPNVKWVSEEQITNNGNYLFKHVPTGIDINILVTKEGYKNIKRGFIVKSNLEGNPLINKFNFGGNELKNDIDFAISNL